MSNEVAENSPEAMQFTFASPYSNSRLGTYVMDWMKRSIKKANKIQSQDTPVNNNKQIDYYYTGEKTKEQKMQQRLQQQKSCSEKKAFPFVTKLYSNYMSNLLTNRGVNNSNYYYYEPSSFLHYVSHLFTHTALSRYYEQLFQRGVLRGNVSDLNRLRIHEHNSEILLGYLENRIKNIIATGPLTGIQRGKVTRRNKNINDSLERKSEDQEEESGTASNSACASLSFDDKCRISLDKINMLIIHPPRGTGIGFSTLMTKHNRIPSSAPITSLSLRNPTQIISSSLSAAGGSEEPPLPSLHLPDKNINKNNGAYASLRSHSLHYYNAISGNGATSSDLVTYNTNIILEDLESRRILFWIEVKNYFKEYYEEINNELKFNLRDDDDDNEKEIQGENVVLGGSCEEMGGKMQYLFSPTGSTFATLVPQLKVNIVSGRHDSHLEMLDQQQARRDPDNVLITVSSNGMTLPTSLYNMIRNKCELQFINFTMINIISYFGTNRIDCDRVCKESSFYAEIMDKLRQEERNNWAVGDDKDFSSPSSYGIIGKGILFPRSLAQLKTRLFKGCNQRSTVTEFEREERLTKVWSHLLSLGLPQQCVLKMVDFDVKQPLHQLNQNDAKGNAITSSCGDNRKVMKENVCNDQTHQNFPPSYSVKEYYKNYFLPHDENRDLFYNKFYASDFCASSSLSSYASTSFSEGKTFLEYSSGAQMKQTLITKIAPIKTSLLRLVYTHEYIQYVDNYNAAIGIKRMKVEIRSRQFFKKLLKEVTNDFFKMKKKLMTTRHSHKTSKHADDDNNIVGRPSERTTVMFHNFPIQACYGDCSAISTSIERRHSDCFYIDKDRQEQKPHSDGNCLFPQDSIFSLSVSPSLHLPHQGVSLSHRTMAIVPRPYFSSLKRHLKSTIIPNPYSITISEDIYTNGINSSISSRISASIVVNMMLEICKPDNAFEALIDVQGAYMEAGNLVKGKERKNICGANEEEKETQGNDYGDQYEQKEMQWRRSTIGIKEALHILQAERLVSGDYGKDIIINGGRDGTSMRTDEQVLMDVLTSFENSRNKEKEEPLLKNRKDKSINNDDTHRITTNDIGNYSNNTSHLSNLCINSQYRKIQNAFCIIRPPGHHSGTETIYNNRGKVDFDSRISSFENDIPSSNQCSLSTCYSQCSHNQPASKSDLIFGGGSGFCHFNNVAVAIATATRAVFKHRIKKVLIVDWDLHHGNGTENIFYEDGNVLYFSIHQYGYRLGHILRRRDWRWKRDEASSSFAVPYGTSEENPGRVASMEKVPPTAFHSYVEVKHYAEKGERLNEEEGKVYGCSSVHGISHCDDGGAMGCIRAAKVTFKRPRESTEEEIFSVLRTNDDNHGEIHFEKKCMEGNDRHMGIIVQQEGLTKQASHNSDTEGVSCVEVEEGAPSLAKKTDIIVETTERRPKRIVNLEKLEKELFGSFSLQPAKPKGNFQDDSKPKKVEVIHQQGQQKISSPSFGVVAAATIISAPVDSSVTLPTNISLPSGRRPKKIVNIDALQQELFPNTISSRKEEQQQTSGSATKKARGSEADDDNDILRAFINNAACEANSRNNPVKEYSHIHANISPWNPGKQLENQQQGDDSVLHNNSINNKTITENYKKLKKIVNSVVYGDSASSDTGTDYRLGSDEEGSNSDDSSVSMISNTFSEDFNGEKGGEGSALNENLHKDSYDHSLIEIDDDRKGESQEEEGVQNHNIKPGGLSELDKYCGNYQFSGDESGVGSHASVMNDIWTDAETISSLSHNSMEEGKRTGNEHNDDLVSSVSSNYSESLYTSSLSSDEAHRSVDNKEKEKDVTTTIPTKETYIKSGNKHKTKFKGLCSSTIIKKKTNKLCSNAKLDLISYLRQDKYIEMVYRRKHAQKVMNKYNLIYPQHVYILRKRYRAVMPGDAKKKKQEACFSNNLLTEKETATMSQQQPSQRDVKNEGGESVLPAQMTPFLLGEAKSGFAHHGMIASHPLRKIKVKRSSFYPGTGSINTIGGAKNVSGRFLKRIRTEKASSLLSTCDNSQQHGVITSPLKPLVEAASLHTSHQRDANNNHITGTPFHFPFLYIPQRTKDHTTENSFVGDSHYYHEVSEFPPAGRNMDVALPTTGFSDLEYIYIFIELLLPIILSFNPDVIVISCGFDSSDNEVIVNDREGDVLSPYTKTARRRGGAHGTGANYNATTCGVGGPRTSQEDVDAILNHMEQAKKSPGNKYFNGTNGMRLTPTGYYWLTRFLADSFYFKPGGCCEEINKGEEKSNLSSQQKQCVNHEKCFHHNNNGNTDSASVSDSFFVNKPQRLLVVLEGGYNTTNNSKCVEAVLRALQEVSDNSHDRQEEIKDDEVRREVNNVHYYKDRRLQRMAEETVEKVKKAHEPYW